jgi:hypothetical protein
LTSLVKEAVSIIERKVKKAKENWVLDAVGTTKVLVLALAGGNLA